MAGIKKSGLVDLHRQKRKPRLWYLEHRTVHVQTVCLLDRRMPPKNAKKPAGKQADASSSKDDKKEAKGGTSVKVRHILCEKQVAYIT